MFIVGITGALDVTETGVMVENTSELNDEVTEETKGVVLETSITVLESISVLENELVVKISVLGSTGDTVDIRSGVLGSLNDMIVVFGIISVLDEIGGVGDGAILVDSITPVVIIVGSIVTLDVGVLVNTRLEVVTVVMILSVETKKVEDTTTLVESIPRLVAIVTDNVSVVVDDIRLDISALLEGEIKGDCDVTLAILEVIIVGNNVVLVTGIILLSLLITEVNNALVVLETGELVTITLEGAT